MVHTLLFYRKSILTFSQNQNLLWICVNEIKVQTNSLKISSTKYNEILQLVRSPEQADILTVQNAFFMILFFSQITGRLLINN